jgi:hypothetical protein
MRQKKQQATLEKYRKKSRLRYASERAIIFPSALIISDIVWLWINNNGSPIYDTLSLDNLSTIKYRLLIACIVGLLIGWWDWKNLFKEQPNGICARIRQQRKAKRFNSVISTQNRLSN